MGFSIGEDTPIEDVAKWLDVNGKKYAAGVWSVGDDLLCEACLAGRLDIVIMLCDVSIMQINNILWECCAIEHAVINGYLDIVKYLIEKHNVPLRDSLMLAVLNGWIDILEYLLTLDIDINVEENNLLGLACKTGNIDAVDRLLAAGANPNLMYTFYYYGWVSNSILDVAISNNRLDIVMRLVIYGVDIHFNHFCKNSPLSIACLNNCIEIADFLIGLGCDVNFRNSDNSTILSTAILNNSVEVVKLLLKNNAEVGDLYDSMTDEMKEFVKKN